MNMKKLNEILDKRNETELVTVLVAPAGPESWQEEGFAYIEEKLKLLGFVETDTPHVYLNNQTIKGHDAWGFLLNERDRQGSTCSPSIVIDFSSSEAVDQKGFDEAAENNCLSYYADKEILKLAKML